jgi:hypothetical protein
MLNNLSLQFKTQLQEMKLNLKVEQKGDRV